ncbi:unnamed protein product, partial [Didymodactylos carnosus]
MAGMTSSHTNPLCPLCRSENIKIYAVGDCTHPVCYLCSTKMRVLCKQHYCAICRKDLQKVYFVSDLSALPVDTSKFVSLQTNFYHDGKTNNSTENGGDVIDDGDGGIYYPLKFEWIKRSTEKLLRNFCPFCSLECETFLQLTIHVRKEHGQFYCELCAENLNLFANERKTYSRRDLLQHMRYGDKDGDTVFKGHPMCQFCDQSFMDTDQLYKHLRKEHFYCHMCDNDNVYYSDYELLRDHFRSSHYLCEIGECKDVQFTNAFRNEIDFRAHQANVHSRNRAEARQFGTIPMEFQLTSRDHYHSHHSNNRRRNPVNRGTFSEGQFKTQNNSNRTNNSDDFVPDTQPLPHPPTVPTIDEFPRLGAVTSASSATTNLTASIASSRPTIDEKPQKIQSQYLRGAWINDALNRSHSSDDFPALVAATSSVDSTEQPKGAWRQQQQQQNRPLNQLRNEKQSRSVHAELSTATHDTFATTAKKAAVIPSTKEDFPALAGAANTRAHPGGRQARIPPPVIRSAWIHQEK